MRPYCQKHHVPLRRVTLAPGKFAWLCQYSHRQHREAIPKRTCRRCHRDRVYAEGLCYPCWYYRA